MQTWGRSGTGGGLRWQAAARRSCLALIIAAGGAACLPYEDPGGTGAELDSTDDAVLDDGSDAGSIPDDTYPWLVEARGCGAALVASNVVVTAAHCVDANSDQYEAPGSNTPFVGIAGVTVTAANLGAPPAGTPPRNDLGLAIASMAGAGPALAHPWFAGGEEGSDVAVIVYPADVAVPRHLLRPLRVAMSPIDPVLDVSDLVSPTRHQIVDEECVRQAWEPMFLRTASVTGEVDADSRSYWDFDTDESHSCPGDSGSPILSDGKLVSVLSTGDHSSHFTGPALSAVIRPWLVANALDRDGDGWEAWEDLCDTDFNWPGNRAPQIDRDGDGVAAPCDPCDHVAQEWLYDSDGDTIIDCLDPCPDDAGIGGSETPAGWGDEDSDGICDGVDACLGVATPIPFENANLEAENAWTAEVLPDACDPVLIPKGAIDTSLSTSVHLGSVQTTFYKAETWIQKDDHVKRRHRRSRSKTEGEAGKVTVPSVQTDARFCQPGDAIPNCRAEDVVDEDELQLGMTPAQETPQMPYHRISLGGAARGATVLRDYDDTAETLRWDYAADEQFWTANGIVVVPPPESHPFFPGVSASGLDGMMWFHARSSVGHPGGSSVGTGVHLAAENITGTAQLASHYFVIDPESIRHTEKHFPLELDQPIFAWRDLPRWPDREIFWGVDPLDDVMIFETTSQEVGYLTDDGLLQPLGGVVTPTLQTRMIDPALRWLRSEESASHRSAPGAPVAVAFDTNGTSLVEVVFPSASGEQLMTSREAGAILTLTPVTGATGFRGVYARSLGAAFRVGGKLVTSTTGSVPAGVWRFDVSTGQGGPLYTGLTLGTVQAATFDAVSRELVVLDRVTNSRGVGSLRLLRIDAFGRGGRIIGTWTHDGPCARYALAVDGRGRLIVTGSKDRDVAHAMYAVAGEGKLLTTHRIAAGAGILASAPWSNETVLYLPVEGATSTSGASVQRVDLALDGVVASLGECF